MCSLSFPEIRLRLSTDEPPTMFTDPASHNPLRATNPTAAVPLALVPMKLHSKRLPVLLVNTPVWLYPLTTMPRSVNAPEVTSRPSLRLCASSTTLSVGGHEAQLDPGCVVPSIVTDWVMNGNVVAGVMVFTPAPAMLNLIVSVPGLALDSAMAARSVQMLFPNTVSQRLSPGVASTLSLVELTVNALTGTPGTVIETAEKFDVLPLASVAVATSGSPRLTWSAAALPIGADTEPGAAASVRPRNTLPWPLAALSAS